MLERLFEKLNTGADGQTFALKGELALRVYFFKRLILPREFKYQTDGSVRPDTKIMANFDQLLSFNSDRHTDEGCNPVENLPLFYKNKGKE